MKKIRFILIAFIFCLIPIINVGAADYVVTNPKSHPIEIQNRKTGEVRYVYCTDPNVPLNTGWSVSCGQEIPDHTAQQMAYLAHQAGLNDTQVELAIRIAAHQNGTSHRTEDQTVKSNDEIDSKKYEKLAHFCNYEQYKIDPNSWKPDVQTHYEECGGAAGLNNKCIPKAYTDNVADVKVACDAIKASQAYINANGGSVGSGGGSSTGSSVTEPLKYTKSSVSPTGLVTIVVTSEIGELADMEFTCGDDIPCTWTKNSNTQWTIELQDNGDCQFTLSAYYSANGIPKGVDYCKTQGQYLINASTKEYAQGEATLVDPNTQQPTGFTTAKTPTTTITGGIAPSDGDYYANTCAGKCPEAGFDQQTTIECGMIDKDAKDDDLFVNCCDDEEGYVSYYKQARLNQLYCETKSSREVKLGLENWDPKCGAKPNFGTDRFPEESKHADYCQEFCSEKLGIEIPGQINGEAGMYFKLRSIDHLFVTQKEKYPGFTPTRDAYNGDIYSPYIIGVKRCRTRIDYEAWRDDYVEKAEEAMEAFNLYQEYKAKWDVLDVVDKEKKTMTYTPSMTCKPSSDSTKRDCTATDAQGNTVDIDDPKTGNIKSVSSKTLELGSRTVTLYNFTGKNINYYQIEHNITGNIRTENFYYGNDSSRYYGIDYKVKSGTFRTDWDEGEKVDQKEMDTIIAELNALTRPTQDPNPAGTGKTASGEDYSCSEKTVTYTCEYDATTKDLDGRKFPMKANKESTMISAESGSSVYNINIGIMRELEKVLTDCDEIYNEDRINLEEEYNWEEKHPDVAFKYAQVYYDQTGTVVIDSSEFKFKDPEDKVCVVTRKPWDGKDEDQWYSNSIAYEPLLSDKSVPRIEDGSGQEVLKSFGNKELNPKSGSGSSSDILKNAGEFTNYKNDEGYEAKKVWGHDMAVQAECYWVPSDKPWQTLYPNAGDGISSSNVRVEEMPGDTGHYKVITTYMSVWAGSYETAWFLQGFGREGNGAYDFETKFNKESEATCSFQHVDELIKNEKKIGTTGALDDENPINPATAFTCKAVITKQITQTEGCPPLLEGGVSVGINYTSAQAREACCGGSDPEACPTVEPVLKSSIVDPTVICPTGTDCTNQFDNFKNSSGDWNGAYNEIRETAIADKTYAPENVSYTATLTPSTIREIKGEKGSYGTTKDSGFNCKTPSDNTVEGTETVVAAGECTSTFVTKYTDNANEARSSGNVHSAWYGRYEIG